MSWWDEVVDTVSAAASAVVEEVKDFVENVTDSAEDFADDVSDSWNDAWGDFETALKEGNFVQTVVAFFGTLAAGTTATVGSVLDIIIDVAGAISAGLVGVGGAIVGGVIGVLVTAVSGDSDNGKKVARGITWAASGAADFIFESSNMIGDFTERTVDIGASIIRVTTTKAGCFLTKVGRGAQVAGETLGLIEKTTPTGLARVNHFFVLMLENRSFDHMLGQADHPGVDGVLTGKYSNFKGQSEVRAGGDAKLSLSADPPHEFSDVQKQLALNTTRPMGGFVTSFEEHMLLEHALPFLPEDPAEAMRGFSPSRLPVLHALASEFAVCDRWFSSLPGPTLPNRQFVHAASSGGLADSPSGAALGWSITLGGFEYEHGTIYDHLDAKCLNWRVYAGDLTPLVMTLKSIAVKDAANAWRRIQPLDDLERELVEADELFPSYVFIEPNYGNFLVDFKGGNSQHPLDSSYTGEALIKHIYESLRKSPIWPTSALIILYDEHGGFFDHVVPPAARPPGDGRQYQDWAEDAAARAFQFDRLGVRVPAVIVSPLVKKGTVDHEVRDHSSVIATLHARFGTSTLTDRGAHAKSLANLFSGSSFRGDTPTTLPSIFQG